MQNRRMGAQYEFARKATLFASITCTIVATGLCIAAIYCSSWQVVNLREYNSIHEHGLWKDCTQHSRDGNHILQRYTTITEPLHCIYKWDYDKYSGTFDIEDDNSPIGEVNRHKFYGWHISTLVMLALALISSFMSLVVGMCGCCYTSVSLIYTALTFFSFIISAIAEGVFFFYSHRADNRFIKGIVGTYEQRVGLAFFLEMAAIGFQFISFLIAMGYTYFSFAGRSSNELNDHFSIQRSSRTNVTNIGRSMEFDAPLMYPPSTPVPRVPQHFEKSPHHHHHHQAHHSQHHHGVAESMPELGGQTSFHSRGGAAYPTPDFLPPRVRRKSETCV